MNQAIDPSQQSRIPQGANEHRRQKGGVELVKMPNVANPKTDIWVERAETTVIDRLFTLGRLGGGQAAEIRYGAASWLSEMADRAEIVRSRNGLSGGMNQMFSPHEHLSDVAAYHIRVLHDVWRMLRSRKNLTPARGLSVATTVFDIVIFDERRASMRLTVLRQGLDRIAEWRDVYGRDYLERLRERMEAEDNNIFERKPRLTPTS